MKLFLVLVLFTCVHFSYAQSKWHNHFGIFYTGDAQMYYSGASVLIGTAYDFKPRLKFHAYAHYFSKDFDSHDYTAVTVAALAQWHMGKKKRFYVAGGFSYQRAKENDPQYTNNIDRSIVLPAYRIGHMVPIRNFTLCPEINATGPFNEELSSELFTLFSIGLRAYVNRIR